MTGKTALGEARCVDCRHFRNSPEYLEATFKGLAALSSGYASVRKDDGVCGEHDIYLSAMSSCERFSLRTKA
jgi:hypothetical protein